jgi:hypothetical protein
LALFVLVRENPHKCTKVHNGFVSQNHLMTATAAKIETHFPLPPDCVFALPVVSADPKLASFGVRRIW